MKKTVFLVLLLAVCKISLAQDIHDQGVAAIDFGFEKTGIGFGLSAAYLKNVSPAVYIKARPAVQFGRIYNLKYNMYSLDVMGYVRPMYISDYFQLNLGAGLTLGYENVNGASESPSSLEDKNKVGFLAGVKGGADLEVFLSDQFGFFLFGNQAYNFKKSIGTKNYEIGIGFRIFLNNYY